HDHELAGLAERASRFREVGAIPVVSSPEVIATCQDKWAAFQFFTACDIPTPLTYLSLAEAREALVRGVIRFPLLVQPRSGVSSIGIETVENERELLLAHDWGRIQIMRSFLARMSQADPDNCFIFQERLVGEEYGLDVVNDLEGRHACTLARRKLTMRFG